MKGYSFFLIGLFTINMLFKLACPTVSAGEIDGIIEFQPNTPAVAEDVNSNFSNLVNEINDNNTKINANTENIAKNTKSIEAHKNQLNFHNLKFQEQSDQFDEHSDLIDENSKAINKLGEHIYAYAKVKYANSKGFYLSHSSDNITDFSWDNQTQRYEFTIEEKTSDNGKNHWIPMVTPDGCGSVPGTPSVYERNDKVYVQFYKAQPDGSMSYGENCFTLVLFFFISPFP